MPLAALFALLAFVATPPEPEQAKTSAVAVPAGLAPPTSDAPIAEPEDPAAPGNTDEADGDDGESESANPPAGGPDIRYTRDLSDDELQRRWQKDPASLGSISVGFADRGRLLNAVHMPDDAAWICQRPELAWGARETVEQLSLAFRAVHKEFPESAPARLSHIGAKDGGYLRPHHSHQSGRDADIGFFYKSDSVPGGGARRERLIDLDRNWALLRALITQTDVQVILVDRGIQKILRAHALEVGEDRAWVDRIFHAGKAALVQHAKHHKDHFHVRFFAPRSQELGRRIQPLLALRPDQNLVVHRVKRGQTLGAIARAYSTTVPAIQKANKLRRTFLSLDQRLLIPLRKPCTRCPLPPPVVVPARWLPPDALAAKPQASAAVGGAEHSASTSQAE